jgi:hypothetical protein
MPNSLMCWVLYLAVTMVWSASQVAEQDLLQRTKSSRHWRKRTYEVEVCTHLRWGWSLISQTQLDWWRLFDLAYCNLKKTCPKCAAILNNLMQSHGSSSHVMIKKGYHQHVRESNRKWLVEWFMCSHHANLCKINRKRVCTPCWTLQT